MSDDHEAAAPHAREARVLFGHAAAERALLESYRSGRIAHAWLLGGPRSIGKATLAYRMAKFVLAYPDPASDHVQAAGSLEVEPNNPAAHRIANASHSDLLILERTIGDTGKLNRTIRVEQVRRSVPFFGSTAGEGGWRIAIVDAVDDLQSEGENALLKILEEPPARSLLLLVSHAPGRILPTIRSRCRQLLLRPLSAHDLVAAIAAASGRSADDPELVDAAAAAGGSVERGLELLDGAALALRQRVLLLLDRLPELDPPAIHALGDALSGVDPGPLSTFMETVNGWLSAKVNEQWSALSRAGPAALAWEQINAAAGDTEVYNIERKPLVFNVFRLLAEAARG